MHQVTGVSVTRYRWDVEKGAPKDQESVQPEMLVSLTAPKEVLMRVTLKLLAVQLLGRVCICMLLWYLVLVSSGGVLQSYPLSPQTSHLVFIKL